MYVHGKVTHTIIDCLVVGIITATAVLLWTNKNYFAVPNPDIFQYIDDGKQYLQLKLPTNIQTPPINSILICSLARLLQSPEYPEILSAHIINVVAAIITMCLLYLLIRSYSRIVGALVIVLLATNPLFIFSSLNVTSEVLFTTAIVLALLLYRYGRFRGAYITAGLSFLIRYEGLLLLISMIALDWLRRKSERRATVRLGLLAFTPVCLWLMIAAHHNNLGGIVGNDYVREVVSLWRRLPQLQIITRMPINLIDYVMWETGGALRSIGIVLLYFLTLVGAFVLIIRKDTTLRLVFLNASLYIVLHVFFPYAPDRYLYPVVWALYLAPLLGIQVLVLTILPINVGFRRICRVAGVFVVVLVAAGNLQKTIRYYLNDASNSTNFAFPRNYQLEIRLAADWLNNTKFEQPVMVFAYEPWILNYYTKNQRVSFFNAPYAAYQRCDSVACLVMSDPANAINYRIIFIQQSNSFSVDSSFPSASNLNMRMFNQFPGEREKDRFVLLTKLSKRDSWAKIYQFLPEK